jgi:hypothetical protein
MPDVIELKTLVDADRALQAFASCKPEDLLLLRAQHGWAIAYLHASVDALLRKHVVIVDPPPPAG